MNFKITNNSFCTKKEIEQKSLEQQISGQQTMLQSLKNDQELQQKALKEFENVFEDITQDSTGIFQFESDFAKQSIKKMHPMSVDDICLCSACLRPSGESYREQVYQREFNKNPSELIDNLLADSYGFLVYQEQTIAFLQEVCGFSGSEADNIRRAIGKKQKDKIDKALPQILEGYCNKSDKPRDIAEQEAKKFIQYKIIQIMMINIYILSNYMMMF